MSEERLNYRTDGAQTYVYRGADRFPIARFKYFNSVSGWKLWWVDPAKTLSIAELKQMGQIGENLAGEVPTEEALPATATFVDITKENQK